MAADPLLSLSESSKPYLGVLHIVRTPTRSAIAYVNFRNTRTGIRRMVAAGGSLTMGKIEG